MIIEQFVSGIFNSNMYVIRNEVSRKAIVIDPGESDERKLIGYLEKIGIEPAYVILTHEHFDHCAGVNVLERYYDFDLLVTEECAEKIKNGKGNLSRYAMEVCCPFGVTHSVFAIDDFQEITMVDSTFCFIKTPGHSAGSMCIQTENCLFSGDTLLETKIPVKLPGGNRQILESSIQKLNSFLRHSSLVYPGHGSPFLYKF